MGIKYCIYDVLSTVINNRDWIENLKKGKNEDKRKFALILI